MRQLQSIQTRCEHGRVAQADLWNEVVRLLDAQAVAEAHVYAECDCVVGLGTYRAGEIKLALGPSLAKSLPRDLNALRVFTPEIELRALRSGKDFCWRLRVDGKGEETLDALDEAHKLWGVASDRSPQIAGWSRLHSGRCADIYVPGEMSCGAAAGLRVRNYIGWAEASKGEGVLRFVDDRLCGLIANWTEEATWCE